MNMELFFSFLRSLFLYNPLEAMMIIGLINSMSKIRMSIKDVVMNGYMLGAINCFIMFMPTLFSGDIKYFIDMFMIFILAFAAFNYYKYVLNKKIKLIKLVLAFMTFFIVAMVGALVFNILFGNIYIGNQGLSTFSNLYYEFMANIITRLIGLILILITRRK